MISAKRDLIYCQVSSKMPLLNCSLVSTGIHEQGSRAIAKMTARRTMRPRPIIIWCPEVFRESLSTHTTTFPPNF